MTFGKTTLFIALLVLASACAGCSSPARPSPTRAGSQATVPPTAPASPTAVATPSAPPASPTATLLPKTQTPTPKPTFQALSTARPKAGPTATKGPDASYADPQGFYAIAYPATWSSHPQRSEMQFWADAQGKSGLAVSMQIKVVSAESMVEQALENQSLGWDDYEELGREETTLHDYPASWVDMRWVENGAAQRGFIVGLVRNRIGFLLQAWSPEESYPDVEAAFRAAVESLSLNEYRESPPYDQWETYQSPHLVFRYLPGTYVAQEIESIAEEHERAFEDIVSALELDYTGPVMMYMYPSQESLYRATARDAGFAITEEEEVHTVWVSAQDHQSLGHEMTHVITAQALGDPTEALLGEGIAVCLDHSGRDHDQEAADLLKQGKLVPLSGMLGNAWFEQDAAVAYIESGSLACYLLDKYGVDSFQALYLSQDFPTDLEQICQVSLEQLEQEWLAKLRAR